MRNSAILFAALALSLFSTRSASAAEGATIGQRAPAFAATEQNGNLIQSGDFAGKIIVLEWLNPDCPYAQRHAKDKTMQTLADKYKSKDVVWIGVNSGRDTTNQINAKWVKDNNLSYPVLNDGSSAIAKAYGAKATPHMFIIDKTGKLVYKGAIDNDRDGEKTTDKVNYVSKALDEVLAGKPVSVPETAAYGCSVKYR